MSEKYKTVKAKCPECGREMNLSFEKDSDTRYTYCWMCEKAVTWKEVTGDEDDIN